VKIILQNAVHLIKHTRLSTAAFFLHLRMKLLFCLLLLLSTPAPAQELQRIYNDAMTAYKSKHFPEFYSLIKEANRLRPEHPGIQYQVGVAAALTGKPDEALQYLKRALLADADLRLAGIADFKAIQEKPGFQALVDWQRKWQQPEYHSDTALVIGARSLHTEGVAYDAAHHTFYLGSIRYRKIVKVVEGGNAVDFCQAAFEGMGAVFGLKVDARRNCLWVCTSPVPEMIDAEKPAAPEVLQFDLSTGKILHRYPAQGVATNAIFGDLTLNASGQVFVSDSRNNTVSTINEKTHHLEPFYSNDVFQSLQGLAFSADGRYLYLADYVTGIYRLTLKTRELLPVTTAADVSLQGIDGLYCVDHTLIAIQNGVKPLRCTRYSMNAAGTNIVSFEILDRKHPAYDEPTLGVVDGDHFYYVANSQWNGYDAQHHPKPDSELHDIVVLRAKIK